MANITVSDLKPTLVAREEFNPILWDGTDLRLPIRVALLKAAKAFFDFLEVPDLAIHDIILTGSNAALNYTEFSDLDVHIVVSYEATPYEDIASNFFSTKKNLWNETHEIIIKGYRVEMYVEDSSDPVKALGVYSLLNGDWLRKPSIDDRPEWNDRAVAAKADDIAQRIDDLLSAKPSPEALDKLINRIRNMRRAGLADNGEFSTENLAFKGLRNLGYMDRLYRARIDAEDESLSLESVGGDDF